MLPAVRGIDLCRVWRQVLASRSEVQEDKYWKEDEKLDEEYAKDSVEECLGSSLFENDGLAYYVGEG